MLRCLKFFPKCLRSGSVGMTLPEVLVSVAITGIVGSFAFNLITDFTRRAWEHEAKSKAIDQRELAGNIIKRELPQFITSVTGRYGKGVPPVDFWTCNPASCRMKINYQYQDVNLGAVTSKDLFPLEAKCDDVSDARLAPADVNLHEKAKKDFPGDPIADSKCLKCPAGKAPRLAVTMYKFDSTSGAPTLVDTKYFPQTVGKIRDQGLLAMGICVDWPPYQHNDGTAAATQNDNRYDRWAVTLIPVYARTAQMGGMNDQEIAASLASAEIKILLSKSKRLAPDFRITPVK